MSSATPAPRSNSRTDGYRAGPTVAGLFVALFGLLLASFPARNPDVWGYLAAGRGLVRGHTPDSPAGGRAAVDTDPGWVFDLMCYGIYSVVGPSGLVIVKALLVAGVAVVLFRLSRTGSGVLIPTFAVGLAVLTMSTRLNLQPVVASYLFLALALWGLRGGERGATFRWPLWGLAVLFAVWANTDRWFVLGLVVTALLLFGRALDRPAGERRGALERAAVATVVLVGACLLNPAHVGAFGLPAGLTAHSPVAGGTQDVWSPFQRAYLEAMAQSPAGLAYFPLLGLGLLSFALPAGRRRWERFLPWLAIAALSALQVRTVPFFAIVSAPMLAHNLDDFFARRATARSGTLSRRGRTALAGLTALFGIVFLACAWTGWLQGPPFGPRRWAVETPAGFRKAAETECHWYADGRLGQDARGLHVSADTAAAFAWFCPEHRAVIDPVLAAGVLGEQGAPSDWAERLRSAGVTHVVVYNADRRRMTGALTRLLEDPDRWPLLHLDGGVTVFGWRDPLRPDADQSFRDIAWDADRRTVWPEPVEEAPPARPASEPDARRWWEVFWKSAAPPSDDRNAAAVYLLKAQTLRRSAPAGHLAAWEVTQAAGLTAAAAGWSGTPSVLDAYARLEFIRPELAETGAAARPMGGLARSLQPAFSQARGHTPAAVLYLAIRAARRAVAANAADAQAYALLGEAYMRLATESREAFWARYMTELGQLRRAQAVAALTRAVTLDPDLAPAHYRLAVHYGEVGFADLALAHQRAYLAAVRKAGPATSPDARAAVAEQGAQTDRLADLVDEQKRAFASEASDLRVYDRAVLAKQKGLAGIARDILLESDISAFGANGMALELELLVRTGRVKEVRDWTAAEHQDALGPLYQWLRAQAFAASGDYALAREECTRLAAVSTDAATSGPAGGVRPVMAALAGQTILDGQYGPPTNRAGPYWEAFSRTRFQARLGPFVVALRREADALTLRGLLALEQGDTRAAADDFRQVLRTWGSRAAADTGEGIDFLGRPAAQQALAWIESVPAPR